MLQVGSAVGAAEKLPDRSGHGETEGRPVVFLRILLIILAVIGILTLLQRKLGYYDVHVPKIQYSSTKITYILVIVEFLCLAHAGRLPLRDELDDVHCAVFVVVELGDDPSDLIVGLGCNSVGKHSTRVRA